jgi:hypothetical protein
MHGPSVEAAAQESEKLKEEVLSSQTSSTFNIFQFASQKQMVPTCSNYKSHNPQQSILARKPALRTVLTRIEGCSSTKTSQGTGGEDHNQHHMVSFPPKATKSAGSV